LRSQDCYHLLLVHHNLLLPKKALGPGDMASALRASQNLLLKWQEEAVQQKQTPLGRRGSTCMTVPSPEVFLVRLALPLAMLELL